MTRVMILAAALPSALPSGCTFPLELVACICYYFTVTADTVVGYEFSFPYND